MHNHLRSLSRRQAGGFTQKVRRGFTLLEIIIVIGLIAALAGMAIVGLDKIFGGGQEEVAKIFVNQTVNAPLMAYRLNVGSYPSTQEGLAALMTSPAGVSAKWKGPYLEKEAVDPWQNPYQYRFPGTKNPAKYDVWSYGPDGVESADDIGNWE